jgi:cellobiose phosphorylase
MLTGQVFTIMSRIATDEQVKEIVKASDNYLYDGAVGGYKLNTNFAEVKDDLGRMFGFAYGHKENGAVFSHMAIMYANALYQRGFAAEGYKAINSLYQHCNNFKMSKIYPGIPEYIGPNGRGLYHYLTGSASWLLLTVITEMFGVKGWFGDLLLEPKLLLEQFDENHEASINLIFGNRKLTITYTNPEAKEFNEYKVKLILIDSDPYIAADGCNSSMILRSDLQGLDVSMEHVIVVELG